MAKMLKHVQVTPGEAASLSKRNPNARAGLPERTATAELVAEDLAKLQELQYRLTAEARRSVLVVLQGMDASGKDGVVRHVFSGVNPQGCKVTSFKAPSPVERSHDFLWRIHAALPSAGEIGIFNRSHYEDVVAASVVGAITPTERALRYGQINQFESMLAAEGMTVVKVFLHVSKDEQKRRLEERLADPKKHWKFNLADLDTRAHWDEYQHLYSTALTATSTAHAPWYVVPADRKWVRDAVISRLLVATLERMKPKFPDPLIPANTKIR